MRRGQRVPVFDLKLRNVDAVVANFRTRDRALQREVKDIVLKRGRHAYRIQQSLCPVDTGRMKRLTKLEFTNKGYGFSLGWDAADFFAEGEEFYPPFQEFGTTVMDPQPSLYPAYFQVVPGLEKDLRAALRRASRRKRAA